ncbi:hypothetical protein BHE74_00033030 [Ensete ventricosum]|nr:hypothetical protein BHE74_00033030 [Ensete ventricosum]
MLDLLQIHVPVRAFRSLVGNLKERYRRERRRSIRISRWFSCAKGTRKKDSLPHSENEFQEEPKKKDDEDDADEDSVEASSTPRRRRGALGTQQRPFLGWEQRVRIAFDAAKGLEYLHDMVQPPVVHRNIKSSNILIFDDCRAKIADFDLLNQAPDMATRLLSTRATPRLGDKNKVKQCVDPRLKGLYPPSAAAQFAEVAGECVEYEADHRPDMSSVVKKLRKIAAQLSLP